MAASAGAVKLGGAYVEIFAKDGAFMQAMTRVQNKIKSVASAMQTAGRNMAFGGTAIGAPMLLAIKQAATFEDALLGMRSAAGLTEKQVGTLRQQALALGQAMNASPTKVAGAFLELTKAGMSVDEVLKGAGQSSIEFARVSGVEMADAAVFMKVAMQSFGVSAQEAVDTLSAAADSSETSIASMVESFGLVGSAGALFNQSLFDLAQGMAALARFSVIGEEAGTGIKSILNSLVAPSGVAQDALESLGLTVDNFRGADKKMLPLVQIVGVFEKALKNIDPKTGDRALAQIFGDRGIKVMGAFLNLGTQGFENISAAMKDSLPVSEKYQIVMSGVTGSLEGLRNSTEQVSIAFTESVGPAFAQAAQSASGYLGALASIISQNPEATTAVAALTVGVTGLGAALALAGLAAKGLVGSLAMLAPLLSLPALAGAAALAGGYAIGNAGVWAAKKMGVIDDRPGWPPDDWKKQPGQENAPGELAANFMAARALERKGVDGKAAIKPSVKMNDAELAKLEQRAQAARDAEAAQKAALDAAEEARKELEREDEDFERSQANAIAGLQELSNAVVEESLKLGADAQAAAIEFQKKLSGLQGQVRAGVLNQAGAENLGGLEKAKIDERFQQIRDAQNPKPFSIGPTVGTFGSASQLGIAPALNTAFRQAADAAKAGQRAAQVNAAAANKVAAGVNGMADQFKKVVEAHKRGNEILGRIENKLGIGGVFV